MVELWRFRTETSYSSSTFSLFIADMVSSRLLCFRFKFVMRSSSSALSLISEVTWLSDSALSRFKADISSSTSNFLRLKLASSSSNSSFLRCTEERRISSSCLSRCRELSSCSSFLLDFSCKDFKSLLTFSPKLPNCCREFDNRRFRFTISSSISTFSRFIAETLNSSCWFSNLTPANSLSFSLINSFIFEPPSWFPPEIPSLFNSVNLFSLVFRFSSRFTLSLRNISRSWHSAFSCISRSSYFAWITNTSRSRCRNASSRVSCSSMNFWESSFSTCIRISSLLLAASLFISSLSMSSRLCNSSLLSANVISICAFSCLRSAISSLNSWTVSSSAPFSLTSPCWYLSSSFSFNARFSSEWHCSISDISSSNLSSSFLLSSFPLFSTSFFSFSMFSKSSFNLMFRLLSSDVSFSIRIMNSASKLAFNEFLCSRNACSISLTSLSNLVTMISFSWLRFSFSSFSCIVNLEMSVCRSEIFSSYLFLCFSSSLLCFSSNFRLVSWTICKCLFSVSFLSLSVFISHFSFSCLVRFSASLFCHWSSEIVVFKSAMFPSYFIRSCSSLL